MDEIHAKHDNSEAFLDSLPELQEGESFVFDCNEHVPCFNRCCAELTLPLTPYDVLRLCRHLEMGSDDFIKRYTQIRTFPDTGFPLALLKMQDGPTEPCPFVTPAGCSIYEDRPGACRTYPLGRGTKMGEGGSVVERFFIVREDHCRGFDTGKSWTAHEWLKNQDLEEYNKSNDRLMRLLAMLKASGQPLSPRMGPMCVLAFYQLDKFKEFLQEMGALNKVVISEERKKAIMNSPEALLDFALDWVELVLFGQCPNLERQP